MKLEIYKCAMLTVIAGVMVFFAWKIQARQIFVEVRGGDIQVTGDVSLAGTVEVTGKDGTPVEITGEVTGDVTVEH